ncbi:MAG TPA: bifunctional adenosylcobinamide kinase/adenosylcobinamide-phosphate guanylyltransferase [Thermaerobacter sp.]
MDVTAAPGGTGTPDSAGHLILVLGGARSGKSDFAQRLAAQHGGDRVLFVATAEAADDEMARRIAAHRRARPASWRTVEAPRDVGAAVRFHLGDARAVLVDCLTLLVSNVLLAAAGVPGNAAGWDESGQEARDVAGAGAGAGATIPDEVAAAAERLVREEVEALVAASRDAGVPVIVVSNEVGWGLVPGNPLARLYRDLLGRANQALAAQAESVYLLVAGVPLTVKGRPAP